MDATLANAEKLLDLLKGFKYPEDVDACTGAQIMEIGEHNNTEYERLELEEPEKISRINGLLIRLFSKIQPLIIEKYGVVNSETTREFLTQFFREVEDKTNVWQRLGSKLTDEIDLEDEQIQLITELIKILPYLMIEELIKLVGNSFLFPEENSSEIVNTLVEIAKEADNADHSGNN